MERASGEPTNEHTPGFAGKGKWRSLSPGPAPPILCRFSAVSRTWLLSPLDNRLLLVATVILQHSRGHRVGTFRPDTIFSCWTPVVSTLLRLCFFSSCHATPRQRCGATLIICPHKIRSQWEREIRARTKPGALKVRRLVSCVRRKYKAGTAVANPPPRLNVCTTTCVQM